MPSGLVGAAPGMPGPVPVPIPFIFSSRSDGLHMGIWSDDAISLSSFDALYNLRILRDPGQKVGWGATIIFTKVRKIFHGSSFFYAFWLYFEDIVILSCFQDMDLYLLKGLVEIKQTFSGLLLCYGWMSALKVFEARVPRDLLPVFLPQEKNNPTSYTSLSNPNATSIRHQSNGSTGHSTTTNCSTRNATTGCALCNFVVLSWGCMTSNGLKLTNTCHHDNWMMIFQSLVKSHMLNLYDLGEPCKLINTSLCLLDSHQYGDAKLVLIPQTLHLANRSDIINLYTGMRQTTY